MPCETLVSLKKILRKSLSWKDARNFQNRAGNDDFQNNRDDGVWASYFKTFLFYLLLFVIWSNYVEWWNDRDDTRDDEFFLKIERNDI